MEQIEQKLQVKVTVYISGQQRWQSKANAKQKLVKVKERRWGLQWWQSKAKAKQKLVKVKERRWPLRGPPSFF